MTIERLSSPEGVPVPGLGEDELRMLVLDAVRTGKLTRAVLEPGGYDLASEFFGFMAKHQLTVLPDGTAIYRTVAKDANATSYLIDSDDTIDDGSDERVRNIPQDTNPLYIMGPKPGERLISAFLFDVISYHD